MSFECHDNGFHNTAEMSPAHKNTLQAIHTLGTEYFFKNNRVNLLHLASGPKRNWAVLKLVLHSAQSLAES